MATELFNLLNIIKVNGIVLSILLFREGGVPWFRPT